MRSGTVVVVVGATVVVVVASDAVSSGSVPALLEPQAAVTRARATMSRFIRFFLM
jgi:hypothetical protein